jgi:hypothetical protein
MMMKYKYKENTCGTEELRKLCYDSPYWRKSIQKYKRNIYVRREELRKLCHKIMNPIGNTVLANDVNYVL